MNTVKQDIRTEMLARRMALPEDERKAACIEACDRLVSIPLEKYGVVAGYKAIRGEVDILQALLACHDKHYALCLPSVTVPEKMMRFLAWHPEMPMKTGERGTLEPENSTEVVPTTLWVPLVAFDRSGHRLGYGGGYYDATLAHLRKQNSSLMAIGVGFAMQEIEKIPTEIHDMRLDMIVTEREIIQPGPATSAGHRT